MKEEIKNKIIEKVKRLLKEGYHVNFGFSEQYRTDVVILDKIKYCKDSIQGSDGERWEPQIYISFNKHPVLYGSEADEVLAVILGENKNLLDKYLSE